MIDRQTEAVILLLSECENVIPKVMERTRCIRSCNRCNRDKKRFWHELQKISCFPYAISAQAREHCEMVDPSVRQRDTSAIIRRLADWAVANRALNDIIKLPFNAREEQVLE